MKNILKIINKMKIILDNIKIEELEYYKSSEIFNWPNSFDLFRYESILSMYFNFIKFDYIKVTKEDDYYLLLLAIIEKDKKDIDPYELLEKYKEYVVLMDIKKQAKGVIHKKWIFDIFKNEIMSSDSLFIDENFILEKIDNSVMYNERYNYYQDLLKLKKSSKIIVKRGEFPFIGQFKIIKNNEYTNINNSVDKPYFEKYKLVMFGDHFKVNGAGILYNIMYFLKTHNIKEENIHICFTLNTNKLKFYMEIISNNANTLDILINSFYTLSEQVYLDYDIIETENQKLNIINSMEIYNMIDFKYYTIYSKFN